MASGRGILGIVLTLVGAAAGFAAGAFGGMYVFEWLLGVSGESSGWEDLAGLAASLFTFGPLGAALGMAVARRPPLEADQRRWLLAALVLSAGAAVVTWFMAGVVWGVAVFVWGATFSLLLWAFSRRRR